MGSFRSDLGFSFILSIIFCVSDANADDHIGKNALQFSPSISLGSEYRTNLYLQEGLLESSNGSVVGQPLTAGTAILINPVAKLKYQNSGINTVLGINYRAKKYISSDEIDLTGLDRFKDVQLLGSMDLYPVKEFGISLNNSLLSSGRETSADDTGSAYLQTVRNNFRGGLLIRPGSALEIGAGGVYGIVDITDAQSAKDDPSVVLNNKQSMGWYADAQWKFFPRTSFFLNVSQENFDWQNKIVFSQESCAQAFTADCSIASAIPNGSTLRTSFGLSGRFSERLLMKAALNYGTATYDTETLTDGITLGDQLTTMVDDASANLEGLNGLGVSAALTYMFSDTHSFNLAYDKDFMDVYFTNFSVYHQASVEYSVLIMRRVRWDTNFRYRVDSYEGSVTRQDNRFSINSGVDIVLQKRTSLHLGGGWSQLASAPEFYDIEYDDFRVHGGLVLGY
jgi:hypothetical protein